MDNDVREIIEVFGIIIIGLILVMIFLVAVAYGWSAIVNTCPQIFKPPINMMLNNGTLIRCNTSIISHSDGLINCDNIMYSQSAYKYYTTIK